MKGTLEIYLQFEKLTNNSANSFMIPFGLQWITDELIHVHSTHYTPQRAGGPLNRSLKEAERQDTGKTSSKNALILTHPSH